MLAKVTSEGLEELLFQVLQCEVHEIGRSGMEGVESCKFGLVEHLWTERFERTKESDDLSRGKEKVML